LTNIGGDNAPRTQGPGTTKRKTIFHAAWAELLDWAGLRGEQFLIKYISERRYNNNTHVSRLVVVVVVVTRGAKKSRPHHHHHPVGRVEIV
jgi:hypothetical protein